MRMFTDILFLHRFRIDLGKNNMKNEILEQKNIAQKKNKHEGMVSLVQDYITKCRSQKHANDND